MSTRDDPKKVSDRSARYLRREEKKEDPEDPQERDQRKGKGKGKRSIPLLPVIAPPQTRRLANSPSTHKAYVREKLASIPIDARLLPLDELTAVEHPTSPRLYSSPLFGIPGDARVFHTLLDLPTEDTAQVQTVGQNYEDLFANTSTSPVRPTTLFRDSNSVRSSGGTSRVESSGGEFPSPPGSPREGPPFPPNPPGGGGGGGGGPPDRPMGDQQGNCHSFTKHSYPKYKGRGDDDAEAYIKLFESVSITNKEDNEADRLRIFLNVLRKKARSWYNHESTIPMGIDTWAKLLEKFLKEFRELVYDSRVLMKLRDLHRERKENLKDYTERFQDLLNRISKTGEGVPYSTQQAIDWYVTGLPMEMETYCRRCRCDTIDEVITSAEAFETSTLNKRPKGRVRVKCKRSWRKRRTASTSSSESSASSESSKSEDSSSSEDERKPKKGSKKKNMRMAAPEIGTTSIVSKVDALVKDFADLKSRPRERRMPDIPSQCSEVGTRMGSGGYYTEAPEEAAYAVQEVPPTTPIQPAHITRFVPKEVATTVPQRRLAPLAAVGPPPPNACFNCGDVRHFAPNCPHPRKPKGYLPLCSNCRQQGHIAVECNQPRVARQQVRFVTPSKEDAQVNQVELSPEEQDDENRWLDKEFIRTVRGLSIRRLGDEESQLYRLQEVLALEKRREAAKQRTEQIQLKRKKAYDKRVRLVTLLKGHLALLYDSRHARFPGKLHLRWMGPYKVVVVFPNGSVQLADLS
ncbi:hypothetical protein AXG93_4485s1180 [Marchantia polymorpha subsp. ruderalis]|uniref:CCHC-type domain-containing protein n=1 Tax=Marchantia polymorpha subsp. ruderalis TaxID=1480154 RepID=A0A176WH67_MARPO|nr:hypothetical protein AXG93_4485s1180 [Marchantia polymorpha subsp. ruderalis]